MRGLFGDLSSLVVISSSLCSFSEEELGGTFIGKREVDVVFRSFQIQIMKWALRLGIALLACCMVVVCVLELCFFSCCKSRSSFGNVQNLYVWRNQYKVLFFFLVTNSKCHSNLNYFLVEN